MLKLQYGHSDRRSSLFLFYDNIKFKKILIQAFAEISSTFHFHLHFRFISSEENFVVG